jgi:hypothetical protein
LINPDSGGVDDQYSPNGTGRGRSAVDTNSPGRSVGEPDEPPRFDEDFVRAAAFREQDLVALPKPSRESLREVKREAKQRKKAAAGRSRPAGRSRAGRLPLSRRAIIQGSVAVVLLAGFATGGFSLFGPGSEPTAHAPIPVVVPSDSSAATPTSASPQPSVAPDPFAGTPAAGWPLGDKGIVAPAAQPVAGFSKAQVAAAFAHTRGYLHEALLDPSVVFRGQLGPVIAMISTASLGAWKADTTTWPVNLANRFLPQQLVSGTLPFRVNGFMSAGQGPYHQLRITFHYVVVYDVHGKSAVPGATPTLVGIRRDGSMIFDPRHDGLAAPGWLEDSQYTSDRSDCTRKWPYPAYVEVYLQSPDDPPAPTVSPMAVASMPPYAVLDPRASTAPTTRCFSDTTSLG